MDSQPLDRGRSCAGGERRQTTRRAGVHLQRQPLRSVIEKRPLIFEMGQPGRCGVDLPEPPKVKDRLNGLKRAGEIGLPGL